MPKQLLHEFLAPDEVTPGLLRDAVDEVQPKQRRILDFVEPMPQMTAHVELDVYIEQFNQSANVVGFSDSSIETKGRKLEKRIMEPFHIKNFYPVKSTDGDGFLTRNEGGGWQLDQAAIAYATADLEYKRTNLMRWAVIAMLNDKQFTYVDGKLRVTVPYSRDILDLTDSATKWDNASFDLLDELQRVKSEFYQNSGLIPTVAFLNDAMGRVLIKDPDIRAAFRAAQSSDPENSARTFTSFNFGGINWNILHDMYPALDGAMQKPVSNARIIFGVDNVGPGDGGLPTGGAEVGRPIKMIRCANQLNANNPNGAFYDSFELSKDPYGIGIRVYDNMLPALIKKGVFQHLNNCLT